VPHAPAPAGERLPAGPDPTAGPDQSFLAAVLNCLTDALVACDGSGHLTLFNPAARQLHGLPAVPLPAERWAEHYDLYLPDGVTPMPSEQVPLLRALRGELVRDVEMVVAPVGQQPRILRASGQRIFAADGTVAGAVCVMHDITSAVAAEQERAERLTEQEHRHAAEQSLRRLQQLNAAALAINRQHTVDAVLAAITEQAAQVIGAEQAVSSLTRNEDWAQAINSVVMGPQYTPWAGYAGVTDGSGIYALVCETNTPIRLTQAGLEAHPRWRGFGEHAAEHPPMRGWLAAPLIRRDGSNLGLVQLSDKRGLDRSGQPAEFDDQDEAALVQLAQVASLALEKAVEYEREHEVAVELQRSLLPHLPQVPGLQLAAAYVPGRDEADLTVAGDLYDAFPLDDEHVALALGDVMGHGLMSANLMGQIRSALRALAMLERDPVVLVTALDRLVATLAEDAMATLAYAVLHVPTGRLHLVLAGHPPPLLRTDTGVELLPGDPGLPLGALPGSGYSVSESTVPSGATLLLYSDGLVERRTREIDAGISRLADALVTAPAALEDISEHLLARMTAGQNDDDVAMLLIRRLPPPA
jgi:serine phosphatase RsbU (regulator of sigma subunit)